MGLIGFTGLAPGSETNGKYMFSLKKDKLESGLFINIMAVMHFYLLSFRARVSRLR